jgi:hypothetical protein
LVINECITDSFSLQFSLYFLLLKNVLNVLFFSLNFDYKYFTFKCWLLFDLLKLLQKLKLLKKKNYELNYTFMVKWTKLTKSILNQFNHRVSLNYYY